MVWTLLLIFLIAGTVSSWMFISLFLNSKWSRIFYSDPQAHHTHTEQTSRIGGLGIFIGFLLSFGLLFFIFDIKSSIISNLYGIFFGALACFALGLIDDLKSIDAKFKLMIQILIAVFAHQSGLAIDRLMVPFLDLELDLTAVSLILTIIWFVSIINLINLIDGLDGLAGGIGLMLMVLLVFLSAEKGISPSTFLALGMAGAIFGFLIHNFPPARVYMGDAGAYTIGFVIAGLALMNFQKGAVIAALLGPMMAMALPILDVLFALFRRSMQGLPLFRADKEHIHHKLIRAGLSRQKTVLVLYALSMLALVGGILVFSNQGRFFPIFLGFSSVIVIFAIKAYGNPGIYLKQLLFDSVNARYETQNAIRLSKWFINEIDRMRNGSDFWNDYKWFLKKLGFNQARIILGSGEKLYQYNLDRQFTELDKRDFFISEALTINPFRNEDSIQFWGDRDRFSERRFQLNSEIAHEAFVAAQNRWKDLNKSEYKFDAQASRHENLKIEKARNLYLP